VRAFRCTLEVQTDVVPAVPPPLLRVVLAVVVLVAVALKTNGYH